MNRYSTRSLFILTLALLWPCAALAQTQPNVAGRWEGSIEVEGIKLGISVELMRKESAAWTGAISIPAQGAKDAPLEKVAVKDGTLSFEMPGVPGNPVFKGQLSADGKTITGELAQAGKTFPFKLERSTGTKAVTESYGPTPEKGAPGQGLEGRWQGTLEAGGGALRVVLKVTKAADGSFKALLDSPDQSVFDLPVDAVTLKDHSLRFELKRLSASFTGTLGKDGAEVAGEWQQGGGALPLTLKRLGK